MDKNRQAVLAMREAFHQELDQLVGNVADLAAAVQSAMARATTTLLRSDGELIAQIIADDAQINALRAALDEHALYLLARQQPVATDLRTIVASLRIGNDLQRMGRLARHVAEVVQSTHPEPAIPADLHPTIEEMSQSAQRIVTRAREAIAAMDATAAVDVERADDDIDCIHDSLYRQLLDAAWPHGTAAAVRVALIARYYERYADHAVSVAGQVAFLIGDAAQDVGAGTR